jgi:integrase
MRLSEFLLRQAKPAATAYNIWDTKAPGLVLRIQPSGHRAFKFVYSFRGRPRWYHIGVVYLAEARRMAARLRLAVAEGKDPLAERQAERGTTFAELANRYLEQHAKKHNKSWAQADYLVRKHLLPRWAKLDAQTITRADVRSALAAISAPVVANQTRAAASAIFGWAIKQEVLAANPCTKIERHAVRSRERILSDGELRLFWTAFDQAGEAGKALKLILLLGQRPGEVSAMQREHVRDGWWELPGEPDADGWPGTKNGRSHRVWLPQAVTLPDSGNVPSVAQLAVTMRTICRELGITNKITPHDLRRTHGTFVTRLGFGRSAMNRIQNHVEGGIGSVYDRHSYATETRQIMEAVAAEIVRLAEGRPGDTKVVAFRA